MLADSLSKHDQRRILGQEIGDAIRRDLEFGTENPDFLRLLNLLPKRDGFVCGFADSSPSGPGEVRRNQPDMGNNRNEIVAMRLLNTVRSAALFR